MIEISKIKDNITIKRYAAFYKRFKFFGTEYIQKYYYRNRIRRS